MLSAYFFKNCFKERLTSAHLSRILMNILDFGWTPRPATRLDKYIVSKDGISEKDNPVLACLHDSGNR